MVKSHFFNNNELKNSGCVARYPFLKRLRIVFVVMCLMIIIAVIARFVFLNLTTDGIPRVVHSSMLSSPSY